MLPFSFVSTRVFLKNHSYENVFPLSTGSFSCISVYVEIVLANETSPTRCEGTRYQPSADTKSRFMKDSLAYISKVYIMELGELQ